MGMIPDPRQIGGASGTPGPTPDPRLIGDGDGDGDRGFRALLPWAKHVDAGVQVQVLTPGDSDSDGAAELLWSGSLPASASTGKSRGLKVFFKVSRAWLGLH